MPLKTHTIALFLPLVGVVACSANDDAASADNGGNDELNAVAGAYQAGLRTASGEDVVLAYDPVAGTVPGRPECQTIVANPLRIAVSKPAGLTGSSVKATLDTYIRGRTIAFERSPGESPGAITLTRANKISFRAEIPNVIIGKTCSGGAVEYYQNLVLSIDGNTLIDPVGNKGNFWTTLAMAKKGGISALSRHSVSLASVAGTKAVVSIGKLAGDDPRQPATCDQVQAIPARITVTPAKPAQQVTIKLDNNMRGPSVATMLAPSSPGALTLTKGANGTFSAEIPPFVIDSMCSGTKMEYWQELVLTVDGTVEVDPVGKRPSFLLDLSKAP